MLHRLSIRLWSPLWDGQVENTLKASHNPTWGTEGERHKPLCSLDSQPPSALPWRSPLWMPLRSQAPPSEMSTLYLGLTFPFKKGSSQTGIINSWLHVGRPKIIAVWLDLKKPRARQKSLPQVPWHVTSCQQNIPMTSHSPALPQSGCLQPW